MSICPGVRASLLNNIKIINYLDQADRLNCSKISLTILTSTRTRNVTPHAGTSMTTPERMDFSHSSLGRLPPEIRNAIYTIVLTHHQGIRCHKFSWLPMHGGQSILQALSITSTCRQVRKETKLLFFAMNDITSSEEPLDNYFNRPRHSPMTMETASLLNSIPSALLSPCSRLVTWIPPEVDTNTLALHVQVARNIQHLPLFLGVILGRHGWCGRSDRNGGDDWVDNFHSMPICSRDVLVSMNDCVRIELIFPTNDLPAALALVEDRYRAKIAMVEKHRSHRICPVRVELTRILQSHEQVRRELIDLVESTYQHM
jgi:hypothetical protein